MRLNGFRSRGEAAFHLGGKDCLLRWRLDLGGHGVGGSEAGVELLWVELVVWVPAFTVLGESLLGIV